MATPLPSLFSVASFMGSVKPQHWTWPWNGPPAVMKTAGTSPQKFGTSLGRPKANAKQSAPFSGTPNVEGGNPLLAFCEADFSLNREDVVSILNSAVRDGIGPQDLAELQLELTERSDIHGSALHHIVTGINREIDEEQALEEVAQHQQRLQTVKELQDAITLEAIFPSSIVLALRILNEYQSWPDTLMISTQLSTTSGLLKIGNRVLADPLQGYSVPMNLFHSVVGKSGRGKTPLDQQLISRPIAELVADMARENTRRFNAWWEDNKDKAPAKREAKPKSRYVTIQDYTGEKLTEILSVHDQEKLGLLVRVDELAGLFKRLNQYRGGAGG